MAVAFSTRSDIIATAGADRVVNLWDRSTGELKKTIAAHEDMVTAVLWSTETGKSVGTLEGHTDGVTSLAFTPNAKCLATGSSDGTTKLWSTEKAQLRLTLAGLPDSEWVAWTPDHYFASSPGAGGAVAFRVGSSEVTNPEVRAGKNQADRVV